MSAFYLKGVSPPHVTINQIFAGMMPYMLIVILCMVIMYIWPGMSLWLPNYLYGRWGSPAVAAPELRRPGSDRTATRPAWRRGRRDAAGPRGGPGRPPGLPPARRSGRP